MQLTLAQSLVAAGSETGQPYKFGLLLQVGNVSRITRPEDPPSAWFGDGATAVVVGPVSAGKGLLGRAHRTDRNLLSGAGARHPGEALV